MSGTNHGKKDDSAAERALRDGLRTSALSAEALQRIRAATQHEWRSGLALDQSSTRVRRRWLPLAAAALVTFTLAIGWNAYQTGASDGDAVLGTLARFDAPGIVELRYLRRDISLSAGARLAAGRSLDVRGDSLITLTGGGNLRVARGSAIEVLAADAVKLERGELYVDIPPDARASDQFTVVTAVGEVRHVGTQFAVAIVNGMTRLRVREGSVEWRASEGASIVDAGTELLIDRNLTLTRRPIPTAGRDWAWAETMAPEIEIENRPLQEFLRWFARETGRKLIISDERVRERVATTLMHGDVRGFTPMEALSAVMAAAALRFELPEGAIRVSSAGESAKPPN